MVLFLRLCFWLFGGVFIGVVSFVVRWCRWVFHRTILS